MVRVFASSATGDIGYGFDAPIPYGSGDAFTSFRGEFPISPLAMLNVSASGIEAQHVLADAITTKAVERGRIHYREAWLYFESRITGMTYILTASPHSSAGHDVADYLEHFEEACTSPCVPADTKVRPAAARFSRSAIRCCITQSTAWQAPTSGLATSRAPCRSFQLEKAFGCCLRWVLRSRRTAPSGACAGHFRQGRGMREEGRRVHSVTLRIGNTGASTTFGVGVRAAQVLRLRGLPVDAAVDLWRQPHVLADKTSDPLHTGAGANATIVLPLPRPFRSPWIAGIHVTAGYKSEGFIPGEQLSGGGFARIGIQIR